MGLRFLKIAVVYLIFGAAMGLVMGATQEFTLAPVHAHLLLLGWASLALAGIVYHLYPAASTTLLARIHFWLHNIFLPVFMVGLALVLRGNQTGLPVTFVGAVAVLLGLIVFAANVFLNVKAESQRPV